MADDPSGALNNRLIVLIGGGGFVGRYTARALLKAGARLRIAQRDPRQAFFLRSQGGLGQTQFAGLDIAKPDTIARALQGADMAVNLVGSFTGDLQQIHVEGARVVAEQAKAQGLAALVHLSAIGADPASPAAYARTKSEGEAAVLVAFPAATILRPSVIFGREDQFLNRFARMIAFAADLPLFKALPVLRASARFQPVYVADVAEAIVAALADPARFGGGTLELGGPDVVSMIELHRWLAEATGRMPGFVELPDIAGSVLARLPGVPISVDQWLLLQRDNVVAGENGLRALGLTPTAMAAVAPGWLVRYRKAGRFGARAAVEA